MKKRTNKRGFTVAEIVIAMAVVVLVTATALTTVLTTRNAERNVLQNADALRFAENAWECFKASENEQDFRTAITFAEGVTLTPEGEAGNYTFLSSEYGYTASLTLSGDTLSVRIVAEEKELLSFTYTKGGDAP